MAVSPIGRSTSPWASRWTGSGTSWGCGSVTAARAPSCWLHVLTEIKNRGVGDVCIVVCDGLQGLPDAIATVWPAAVTQTCVVHLLPKQLPLRLSPRLGRHRPRPTAGLYRRHRGGRTGSAGSVRGGLGGPLPGHRPAVGARLGRV